MKEKIFTRNCPECGKEETRKKMSESGKNKPPASEEHRKKISIANKGRLPTLYCRQKTSEANLRRLQTETNTYGISGTLLKTGLHFRSTVELNFLLANQSVKWETAECLEFSIKYIDKRGREHIGVADFVNKKSKTLVEVKPPGYEKWGDIPEKREASIKHWEALGWKYLIVEMNTLPKTELFYMRSKYEISLDPKWERQYQTWMMKH